jgi:hypothetical protein
MKRTLTLVVLGAALVGTVFLAARAFVPRQAPSSFRGIALPAAPSAQTRSLFSQPPPPAWLVVGQLAAAGTYSGFCTRNHFGLGGICADAAPPQELPRLVTVKTGDVTELTMVVDTADVGEVFATTRPWSGEIVIDHATMRRLPTVPRREGNLTHFTLQLDAPADNLLLTVAVALPGIGDAGYLWRLNPR